MRTCVLLLAVIWLLPELAEAANSIPVVSNVQAVQRSGTKLVDITYDVADADNDPVTITIAVSANGGQSFDVPHTTATGDLGANISPGRSKRIVWNAGLEWPNAFGINYMVRIYADDLKRPQVAQALVPANGEIRAFLMDIFEVTNAQYKAFTDATGRSVPSDPGFSGLSGYFANYSDYPVVNVSWIDARDYCAWAGKRLPTEGEWYLAATGGDGRTYPWGSASPSSDLANYSGAGPGRTTPVGSYPQGASPYEIMDMAGNVWEWTSTIYDTGLEAPNDTTSNRSFRGGSWGIDPGFLSTSYRYVSSPAYTDGSIGFRCAQDQ